MDKNTLNSKDTKRAEVASLVEKVGNAKTIAFAAYHGLTVNQIGDLRQKVKDSGGEILVTKNTLMRKALAQNGLEDPGTQLTGPTATILAYDDEVGPIKVVADTAKVTNLPDFKFGFFGKTMLDRAGLDALAKIPGRDVLQGQVVGVLVGPIRGIVNVLNANLRNLAVVLDQIAKQKS